MPHPQNGQSFTLHHFQQLWGHLLEWQVRLGVWWGHLLPEGEALLLIRTEVLCGLAGPQGRRRT